MGLNNTFKQITEWLSIADRPDTTARVYSIPKTDYEQFCQKYIFEKLKGITFGKAFCRRFNLTDIVLLAMTSQTEAEKYIENCKYIKK